MSDAFDGNGLHHHILVGLILPAAWELRNLLNDVLPLYHLTENCMFSGEPCRGRDGNKKLRPVRIRTGVGHGQFPRLVELMGRAFGLVLELVAWTSHASALRV